MSPTSGTTGKSERSLFEKPRGILFRAAFLRLRRRECRQGRRKDLIGLVRSCCFSALFRGLQNLEAPYEGERVVTFCIVQKVTKKHAGLRPATSIQIAGRYVFEAKMTGIHQVPGYAENYIFPGIAGNDLNRCEVRALQRKDLERTAKERLYSLQTVG